MSSKFYFEEYKENIEEEHKNFETFLESKPVNKKRCTHFNKVKMEKNTLVCSCGAAWSGPSIITLFGLFTKTIV